MVILHEADTVVPNIACSRAKSVEDSVRENLESTDKTTRVGVGGMKEGSGPLTTSATL